MRWIGCCNELNAAYAADGYARIKGFGAVCTTYGVGELSAINGIAGAYAEHLPLFHLVGAPGMGVQAGAGGDAPHSWQRGIRPVPTHDRACGLRARGHASAECRPRDRALDRRGALSSPSGVHGVSRRSCRPGGDQCGAAGARSGSDPDSLREAVDAIVAALEKAALGLHLARHPAGPAGPQPAMQAVVEAADLPFATMFMDKSVLDEQHPNYIGIYDGALMNEGVGGFVESCELVLEVGTMLSDFNSGAFTAKLDPARIVNILHHRDAHWRQNLSERGDRRYPRGARAPAEKHRSWKRPPA